MTTREKAGLSLAGILGAVAALAAGAEAHPFAFGSGLVMASTLAIAARRAPALRRVPVPARARRRG